MCGENVLVGKLYHPKGELNTFISQNSSGFSFKKEVHFLKTCILEIGAGVVTVVGIGIYLLEWRIAR